MAQAHAGELALERFDLADAAALAVAVPVEAEQALFLHQGFEQARVGGKHVDGDAVVFADLVDETIGFRVQTTGVEAEHLHVAVELPGHVYQDDVLGAAEGDPQLVAEVLEGGFQDVLGDLSARLEARAGRSKGWLIGLGSWCWAALLRSVAGMVAKGGIWP